MHALLERVEVEGAIPCDDDLPVAHAALGQLCLERCDELGEVTIERLLIHLEGRNISHC